MDVEVTEVEPGELEVTLEDGRRCRVVIPAGVGVAGVDDAELARTLVEVLMATGREVTAVIDASQVFVHDPEVLAAVEREVDTW